MITTLLLGVLVSAVAGDVLKNKTRTGRSSTIISTTTTFHDIGPPEIESALSTDACLRSWSTFWASDDRFWARNWIYGYRDTYPTSIRFDWPEVKHDGFTTTGCDGIPRARWTASRTVWTSDTFVWDWIRGSTTLEAPTCTLSQRHCDAAVDAWNEAQQYLWDGSGETMLHMAGGPEWPGDAGVPLGCAKPICSPRTASRKCTVTASAFALIYPSTAVEPVDLCASEGYGSYTTKKGTAVAANASFTTSALTLTEVLTLGWLMHTLTGPFTFHPSSTYIAFVGAVAYGPCGHQGARRNGVVPVPSTELMTRTARLRDWNGTDLQLAKAIARGKYNFSYYDDYGWGSFPNRPTEVATSWASLDVKDLQDEMPAAKYYQQFIVDFASDGTACESRNCSQIEDNGYTFMLSIPDSIRTIDPAWHDCGVLDGAWDPPIVYSFTDETDLLLPMTASSQARQMPITKTSMQAMAPHSLLSAAPGSVVAPIPDPTRAASFETFNQVPEASTNNPQQGSPSHQPIDQSETTEGEWRRQLQIAMGPSRPGVKAPRLTLSSAVGRSDVLIFGSHALTVNDAAIAVDGTTMALRSNGLVVGTKTIGIDVVVATSVSVTAMVPWESSQAFPSDGGSERVDDDARVAKSSSSSGTQGGATIWGPKSAGAVISATKKAGANGRRRFCWFRQ